jgi:hypothetical protein
MIMRTIYYLLLFVGLLVILLCVNSLRWVISKLQLALLCVGRGLAHRGGEWSGEAAMKESPAPRS